MLSFIALDLETTGLDSRYDEIIEIGMVKVIDGVEAGGFQSLVKPRGSLPVKIQRLTGISNEKLRDAPEFVDIINDVLAFIDRLPVVGHNIGFDRSFLVEACGGRFKSKVYDTLELARLLLPAAANHRLGDLCSLFSIPITNQHRALEDALGAAKLMQRLVERIKDSNLELIWHMCLLLEQARSPWATIFQEIRADMQREFPNKKISPSLPGAPQAEPAGKDKAPDKAGSLSLDACLAILGPAGLMSTTLERFRYRPAQCEMLASVVQAFNGRQILLAEAGTGTGKSLAYLVPSVIWAKQNNERVLIATHTINLQEQLWNKDVPLLAGLPGFQFRAALIKGRSNYLCLRRWMAMMAEPERQPEEAQFLARLLFWVYETATGDRGEIYIPNPELEYWFRVCSESEGCLGSRCRFFNNRCFFAAARRIADRADVVIVNHSLLLSDANTEKKVLPSYGPLVIDEAHHLEKCASEHLGKTIGPFDIIGWLSATGKQISKLEKGHLYQDNIQWDEVIKQSITLREKIKESSSLFFNLLTRWLEGSAGGDYGRVTMRYGPEDNLEGLPIMPPAVQSEMENLIYHLKSMSHLLGKLAVLIEEINPFHDENVNLAGELLSRSSGGEELSSLLEFTAKDLKDDYVYWLEGNLELQDVILRAAPVDVGPLLQSRLFSEERPVVLTSATLSVGGKFDHYKKSVGLELLPENNILETHLTSPFTYNDQVLLCAAKDIPQPAIIGDNAYHDLIAEAIYHLSLIAKGRTMVLFTSHRSLRECYHRLKDRFEDQDICLLGHEIDGSRSRLIEQFMEDKSTVLFGSASFWEGVDIPGQALSCVIIVKLPFSPPNHPILESRLQRIARRGGNGFQEYQIPQAVIKFKQGFGRLIRDTEDRGAVVILDARLIEKKYGLKFFNSLPLAEHFRGNWQQIIPKVEAWLMAKKE